VLEDNAALEGDRLRGRIQETEKAGHKTPVNLWLHLGDTNVAVLVRPP
jgi:hypothetical protein